jgi:anti-anti-sigma factor
MSDKSLRIEKRGEVTCIVLGSDFENLDEQALDTIRAKLLETASSASPPKVVIDLSHTVFFGSSFIEVLFRIWNRINGTPGGKFGIAGLAPYCREVLEITHLDRLWKLYPNLDEAVKGTE